MCFLLYHYSQRTLSLNYCAFVSLDKCHANGERAYDGFLIFVGHTGVGDEGVDVKSYYDEVRFG